MKEKVGTLMEETISLKEIFDILKKHVAAILISMLLAWLWQAWRRFLSLRRNTIHKPN